ncbi:MAG: tRNA (adenosine(37)-N6)-threonylcarbamoyltransferase complex transferase subunit TsaD [Candidatus Zixiibacteriota bacterium]
MTAPGPILGLETSCDETAAAVVSADGRILSNVIFSQSIHAEYGGVVPELASREHAGRLPGVTERALQDAGLRWGDMAGVAVTAGPGLVGCLLVGVSFARAVTRLRNIPLIPVNHIEAHAHTPVMAAEDITYPYLVLIASGGHSSLVRVDRPGAFTSLGETRDDAAGEALDKIGKLLGFSYPAGPELDRAGEHGNPNAIAFPRARFDNQGYDFSFSGVKTAAALDYRSRTFDDDSDITLPDWIASFEAAVVDALLGNLTRAATEMNIHTVGVAGGVARNRRLRRELDQWAEANRCRAILPPPELCTDNAAMIAAVGLYRWMPPGQTDLHVDAVPNWRLGTPFPVTS